MYLFEWLSNPENFNIDTYDIFDKAILKGRMIAIYNYRSMRADVDNEQLNAIAQNTIDIAKPYLAQLFNYANQFDPAKLRQIVRERSGTNSDSSSNQIDDSTQSQSNTVITPELSTTVEPNLITTDSATRSAYNATEQRPYESATSSQTGTTTTHNTGKSTSDTKGDNIYTRLQNGSNKGNFAEKSTEYGVESPSELADAFEKYIQPYDYLARMICGDICKVIW